jgi:glutathione S-transferase
LNTSPDKSITDAEAPKWHKLASVLNAQLAKTKWVAGNELTIADIAVASPLHLHAAARLPLDEHPNIKRWYGQMEKLPEWAKTQGAVEKALLPGRA